jgi:CRP-like cAMP-binding protein
LLLLDGFAYWTRYAGDGRRQIVSFCVPGDIVETGQYHTRSQSLMAAAASTFLRFDQPPESDAELAARMNIATALRRCKLQEENMLHERIFTLGRRHGRERVAALLCELYYRCGAVSLVTAGDFRFPLTQEEIGDASGLSAVHVNRCIGRLQQPGLIALRRNHLRIVDFTELASIAEWEPGYRLYRAPDALSQELNVPDDTVSK